MKVAGGLGASARPVIGTSINLNTSNVPPGGVVGLTIFGFTVRLELDLN